MALLTDLICIENFGVIILKFLSKNLLYTPVFKVPSVASNPIFESFLHFFFLYGYKLLVAY